MLRLNIRHRLPQIGLRTQPSQLDIQSPPTDRHTDYRAARSNVGITQSRIEIDSYPSRKAYGFTNHTDFAREHGQKGLSDLQEATSRRTQRAWDLIENGMKKGRENVGSYYKGQLEQRIKEQVQIVPRGIPDPQVTGIPAQLVGENDPGDVTLKIQSTPTAQINYRPQQVETYLQDQGFLRQWTTEDRYDIYA